ncbi:hypothetical protein [Photobacterium damselae]|uniref:hypothetical protein n=1 Tax=Photobacterium damselae TaxID=38293 RepID=UPI00165DDE14|nr:hypothetical protein [Photobacterium damselae]
MTLKVIVKKILPLGGNATVAAKNVSVHVVNSNSIFNAQTNADMLEVTKLTKEVREAHTHIHADHDCIHKDKANVQANKDTVNTLTQEVRTAHTHIHGDKDAVTSMRNEVKADKANVQANKDTVNTLTQEVRTAHEHIHADKATVASDKANVQSNKNAVQTMHDEVERDRAQVATNTATVNTKHSDVVTKHSQVTTMHREVEADKNEVNAAKAVVLNSEDNVVKHHAQVTAMRNEVEADKNDVNAKHNVVNTKHADVVTKHSDVVTKHNNVVSKHSDVVTKHTDVVKKHSEVNTAHTHIHADKDAVSSMKTSVEASTKTATDKANIATTKANEAATSASNALTQANRSKTEADRAKSYADSIANTGTVNGNLTVTGTISEGGQLLSKKYASPAYVDKAINDLKGGASGAYDTLKEIQAAIESNDGEIGTITSALGTKLDKAGGTLTGDITFSGDNKIKWARNTDGAEIGFKNDSDGDADSYMYFTTNDNNNEYFKWSHRLSGQTVPVDWMTLKGDGLRVLGHKAYTAGNKPTAADVGAVNKAGDTMTAALQFSGTSSFNSSAPAQICYKGMSTVGNLQLLANTDGAGQTHEYIQLSAANGLTPPKEKGLIVGFNELKYNNNNVYHAGNKPTAADVGALTQSQADGRYLVKGLWSTNGGQDLTVHGKRALVGFTNGALHLSYGGDFNTAYFNTNKIYHQGFKPTAADVGALPANGKAVDADKLDGLNSTDFARAKSASLRFDAGGEWTTAQFVDWCKTQGALSVPYWVARGSWDYAGNRRITDTGCGTIHLAGCVVEFIGQASAYTVRITTPTTSSNGGVTNTEFIYVNNGSAYAPAWRKQYNTVNKPTAADVGAMATGTAYTKSESDAKYRLISDSYTKSEVDSRVNSATNTANGKVSKAGDTMTGNLTFSNDSKIMWSRNTDGAAISFKNTSDSDTDSYMLFHVLDNGNEYFKWNSQNGASTTDWMTLKADGLRVLGHKVYTEGNKPTPDAINAYTKNQDLVIDKAAPRLWLRGDPNAADSGKIYVTEDTAHGGWFGYDGSSNVVRYGYRANSVDSVAFEHNYNSPDVRFMGSISMGTTTIRKSSSGDIEFLV